ncbi:hypothetical protein ACU4GI_10825 [Cupriavidus basilensis]
MTPVQAAARQAAQYNIRQDLLREVGLAHEIIRIALSIMTPEQRAEWGKRNALAGIDGEGITRHHERAAVIALAVGSAA